MSKTTYQCFFRCIEKPGKVDLHIIIVPSEEVLSFHKATIQSLVDRQRIPLLLDVDETLLVMVQDEEYKSVPPTCT